MGPQAWICVEQAVVLESDKARAQQAARQYMSFYLSLPNYTKNLKSLGFTDPDLAEGGSDRLVDAIVAWGSESKIRDRISEHFAAGATHVCIQPLQSVGTGALDNRATGLPTALSASILCSRSSELADRAFGEQEPSRPLRSTRTAPAAQRDTVNVADAFAHSPFSMGSRIYPISSSRHS
jgi:hypothetical protein